MYKRQDHGAQSELVKLAGSYIPFPTTETEREESGDPRRSVEERYGSQEEYLKQLTACCRALAESGYLLEEDVERITKRQSERVQPLFEKTTDEKQ